MSAQDKLYENIIARCESNVGVVQINRPQALNALNGPTMAEVVDALDNFDHDPEIGCMILTGDKKAFAAGADIKQMVEMSAVEIMDNPLIGYWSELKAITKPIIAAVSGFCLGGGCELAMACDMIVASEEAKFGQPEINIGVIPGAGGTQRLTRAVGKTVAMEMVLTGRFLSAAEAKQYGLVNQAFEGSLSEGVAYERHLFNMLFSTEDQKEVMTAFIEKRKATWKGK